MKEDHWIPACHGSPDGRHVLLTVFDDGRTRETHCQACGAVLFERKLAPLRV